MEKVNVLGEEFGGMNMKVKDRSYLVELEVLCCWNEEKLVELVMEVKKKNEVISVFKKLKF